MYKQTELVWKKSYTLLLLKEQDVNNFRMGKTAKKKKKRNTITSLYKFLFYSKIWKSKYNECQLKKFHLEAFF